MFVYLSKKIAIPNGVKLRSLAWNCEQGWIACGGDSGLLKVLKLDTGSGADKGKAPNNLSMNQTLDGHEGSIMVVGWNENYRKLTSSDSNGLIIVWMLHKGMWFEEMINNRNKSIVRDLRWTGDGQKICIVYEDGAVIVGSVDGNRLWGKELKRNLSHVEWSPDGRYILFGTVSGEVHIYDSASGTYLSKLPLYCVEDSPNQPKIVGLHWYDGSEGYNDSKTPSLSICFDNGRCQIMRSEVDEKPTLIDTGMRSSNMQWNTQGTVLAIGGVQTASTATGDKKEVSMVQFYNPFGQHLRTLKVPGSGISAISWEGTGLRIALAVDSFIYFANVRPDYKWGYFNKCLVYSFTKVERPEHCVIFWNTKTNEKYTKYVKRLLHVKAAGDNCVLVTKTEDMAGQHIVILCNEIGSPVDSKYIDMECLYVAMTATHVIVCSEEMIYVWQYRSLLTTKSDMVDPHYLAGLGSNILRKDSRERLFHVDENLAPLSQAEMSSNEAVVFTTKPKLSTNDAICVVCASDKYVFVGRESGTINVYTLPNISLVHKFVLTCRPFMMELNCTSSKMSVIDINGVLSFYKLPEADQFSTSPKPGDRLNFERKDVWDMKWASDNSELFAMMEKTRMYIFRGLEPEEPVLSSAYLCTFNKLKIRAVLLDEIMSEPDHPQKDFVLTFETKSLRDTRELLSSVSITDAYAFIEENPHPRLWKLLAEASLEKMDFTVAEKAFVKCEDYKGIQFVKKLRLLAEKMKQQAEVATYFKRFDEAERIYKEIDRKDLAVELRIRLGDWFKVVQLVQEGGGDDCLIQNAWNHIGDYYADRQKWAKAVQYYSQAKNYEKLVEFYYLLEDYKAMERLIDQLPEGSTLLVTLATKFASVGFSTSAVAAFLKGCEVKAAVDCCVELNQWDQAVHLAEQHQLPEIPVYLARYANHLVEKDNICHAVELYKKAGKHTEAAKLLTKLAQRSGKQQKHLRAKQFHVLAAREIDKQRKKLLDTKTNTTAQQALDAMLQHDSSTGHDKSLDNAWHGAEAYHFFMLCHRQAYENQIDSAIITAMRLMEYDDVLDELEVYALIALTAYWAKNWGACSKAFIRLEALEAKPPEDDLVLTTDNVGGDANPQVDQMLANIHSNLSKINVKQGSAAKAAEDEMEGMRKKFQDLAMKIFIKNPPDHNQPSKAHCPHCTANIHDWASQCPRCNTQLHACIVTGRTITTTNYYTCRVCKHRAYDHEIYRFKFCPLCHAPNQ
eukprot:TRINITY_DN67870_c2_g4_i1.p1 TRINITY_DN67870_c2_g4~~TRINITY_DN67870_c2_g4_i1.p1  ORF type:complete len:1236 (-),score=168.86 TRINITY_DN67870_c2_g4_i1:194-3901(-)